MVNQWDRFLSALQNVFGDEPKRPFFNLRLTRCPSYESGVIPLPPATSNQWVSPGANIWFIPTQPRQPADVWALNGTFDSMSAKRLARPF